MGTIRLKLLEEKALVSNYTFTAPANYGALITYFSKAQVFLEKKKSVLCPKLITNSYWSDMSDLDSFSLPPLFLVRVHTIQLHVTGFTLFKQTYI